MQSQLRPTGNIHGLQLHIIAAFEPVMKNIGCPFVQLLPLVQSGLLSTRKLKRRIKIIYRHSSRDFCLLVYLVECRIKQCSFYNTIFAVAAINSRLKLQQCNNRDLSWVAIVVTDGLHSSLVLLQHIFSETIDRRIAETSD